MQVAVTNLTADNGKIILIVVLSSGEAYANKNQQHCGHIRDDQFIPAENGEQLSAQETAAVIRIAGVLRDALRNIRE